MSQTNSTYEKIIKPARLEAPKAYEATARARQALRASQRQLKKDQPHGR